MSCRKCPTRLCLAWEFREKPRGLEMTAGWSAVSLAIALAMPVLTAAPARATGSVVGTDRETRQVGGALATCTVTIGYSATELQPALYAFAPGKGVVHGQAWFFSNQIG